MTEKQICEVCNEKTGSAEKVESMIICDDCHIYFECMDCANDSLGEAWSNFEKANPDKKCTECMVCGEWVALKEITEHDSCPRCGGDLNDVEETQEPAND